MPGAPLSSHPIADAAVDDDHEIHEAPDFTIKVRQSPGFFCHIAATATIKLPPNTLYEQCIVHPDNAKIYRHMDRCTFRRILPTESDGLRRVSVAHEASWRFLLFHGKFTTHLNVIEDHANHVMRFEMAKASSIISKFQGVWQVHPHPTDASSSVSTLDQDIAFRVWMPPPIDRLLKSISARQVRRIVEDLKKEAGRINAGSPSLVPYAEVKDKLIGGSEPPETMVTAEDWLEVSTATEGEERKS